ncbi:methyltransferase domain-containing protein [Actinoplanes sp. TRM 88003]|uniref:Methyltransferase domain-containing protein n=1 Tax=Paractinoplanes aksuensis TaxID=2939490 RepID=A0ABT1DXG3_9ACTN|nr:class I SAM-dependent methyltransferase [Actinoplanes aksuensis]MCO8275551.1 methyltransferase domain-containing protein [Actinoplanes aksuensis]
MTDEEESEQRFAEAVAAAQVVELWSSGAQALSLLAAAHEWGWIRFLATPRDLDRLAEFTGHSPERVAVILDALQAHGVLRRDGRTVSLTPTFATLAADDAWLTLGDVLDSADLARRLVRGAVQGATAPLPGPDALIAARTAGGRPTSVTTGLVERLLQDLPEWHETLPQGHLLDVGCGVATNTLTLARMFPGLRATAVEVVPEVAVEARRRADRLQVADQVDVRCLDARDFDGATAFDSACWAQSFFPEPVRAATLAMIRRALRPGGWLILEEENADGQDLDQRSGPLRRLVRQQAHPALDRTAEELAAEAEAEGFRLHRLASTRFGRFVLLRRPV